ncbi:hypothetical protein [Naasia sp. SYSU D00948]|uniref:hypothetical protein n=1 Tax=Naasia sp. SYSU D00948 TaxID=2817379 RepID=UPI001B30536A|nr:hypothetical protein [Naasia sp. SYSU D00948]
MSPADAAKLLGVATDASIPDIQHAFARHARLSHPDLMAEATDEERHAAGIRFAELRDARDVLVAARGSMPAGSPQVAAGPVRIVRTEPVRGAWSTFLVFLVLAVIVVLVVTIQDGFRTEFVQNLRGVTVEVPAEP